MKQATVIAVLIGWIVLMSVVPAEREPSAGVAHTLAYFREQALLFAESAEVLKGSIEKLDSNAPGTIGAAKETLKRCRAQYKSIEFFLDYFLNSTSLVYNSPPVHEVEEPFMEYREPTGLQVMEALLFEDDVIAGRKELLEQAMLVSTSAADLTALLYGLEIDDQQILESVRLELVRMSTLGIAGYDAPELQTGVTEASRSLMAVKTVLQPYLAMPGPETDSVTRYLDTALKLTGEGSDFVSFNRLRFLTDAVLPLLHHLDLLTMKNGWALKVPAGNIFSLDALNVDPGRDTGSGVMQLGRALFFETKLSGNGRRSCASCHQPEKYFTDQLPKSIALDGHSTVQRNAPTLLYAAFQHAQFWDGRAKTMEEQIIAVLHNPMEMGAVDTVVLQRLKEDDHYVERFRAAFPHTADSQVTMPAIAHAVAAFIRTLAPMDAPLDRYMRGEKSAMTPAQVSGFNLFMGKARCGTCHFVPLFNGLLPPLFNRTELEVIGTTANTDLHKPLLDADSGRFATYPISFYMRAFKTPTLRNVAVTAPYMHNGAFATLEEVMAFYNKGGGAGLGLNVPTQTLSPKPLGLEEDEINDIIRFLDALTDVPAKKM